MSNRILVDTSAFFALINAEDTFHQQAKRLYAAVLDRADDLYTTSYVLVETLSIAQRRLGFAAAKALVDSLEPVVKVYWIDQTIHKEAWKSMVARKGAGLSLVDWTTATVAKRLEAQVFTFDRGFEGEGVPVIPRLTKG